MPEYNEKTGGWDDWVGSPMSKADLEQAKKTTSYLYDMHNLGRGIDKGASPDVRAQVLGDIKKGLHAQYYGKVGLPGSYIIKDTRLGEANIRADASKYGSAMGVEQARVAGMGAASIAAESEAGERADYMNYLGGGEGGGDITQAGREGGGDFDLAPAPTGTPATTVINEAKPALPSTEPPLRERRPVIDMSDYSGRDLPITSFMRRAKEKKRRFDEERGRF